MHQYISHYRICTNASHTIWGSTLMLLYVCMNTPTVSAIDTRFLTNDSCSHLYYFGQSLDTKSWEIKLHKQSSFFFLKSADRLEKSNV